MHFIFLFILASIVFLFSFQNIASRCALLIHTDNDLSRFTLNFLVSVLCAGNVSSFVENFLSVDFYDLFFNILIDDEQISNKKEASRKYFN